MARRTILYSAAFLTLASTLFAQGEESSGLTFGANFQGSSNALGVVTRADTSVGYYFKRHWQIDFGIPYYSVFPSDASFAAGNTSVHGIGNVYTQIRFTKVHPTLNYVSTLTGTAPTGNRDKGLTTGRATIDWGNYFDHSFGRVTPSAEAGIANSVSDTTFFVRPYTTLGFITRVQAGARIRLAPLLVAGASGYIIEPAGGQTVISRVVTQRGGPIASGLPGTGLGRGLLKRGVFEESTTTTGNAGIARDRGFSSFLFFGKNPGMNVYGGFTRSTQFGLNTFFFGVGYNLRKPLTGL